jgi:ribonuclease R
MISANETVSEFISHYDTSFIYRIHDKPEKEVIDEIIDKIALLGYKIKKCNNLNLQKTISSISNDPAYPVLSDMILKGMKRAKYDDYNIGHFALASNYYTHFTSPIRRFPDLLVHSILKNIMHEGVNKIDGDYIHDMAFHSSVKERCAEKAEKEVNEYMCAKYMTKHIGEEVIGVITNIKNDYMEVQTNNMIRGKVMYIDKKCKIGDKVLLVCTDASKHTKSICFDVKNIIVDDEKKLKLSM